MNYISKIGTYRFENFELLNPFVTSITTRYTIDKTYGEVDIIIGNENSKLYGFFLDGFPNIENWNDTEVINWVDNELERFRID